MIKILIVEDEKPISDLIFLTLSSAGYECDRAYDGMIASDKLLEKRYDLILLDIMLPEVNGYELLEFIKPMDIPVIIISAKGKLEDRVRGLKLGADDYLIKPFEILELLARVESVLRRCHKSSEIIEFEEVSINIKGHLVKKADKVINLTDKEFKLLVFFIQNKNVALFREQIYERVWEGEYKEDTRTVDLHIQRLRKKMGWEKKIISIHKIGYMLEES